MVEKKEDVNHHKNQLQPCVLSEVRGKVIILDTSTPLTPMTSLKYSKIFYTPKCRIVVRHLLTSLTKMSESFILPGSYIGTTSPWQVPIVKYINIHSTRLIRSHLY